MKKRPSTELLILCLVGLFTSSEGTGCLEPRQVVNGWYLFDAGVRPGDDGRYPSGSLTRVVCFRGYSSGAKTFIHCGGDEQWSESPTCQVDGCPMPEAPWNGAVRLKRGRRDIGSYAIFSCNKGFNRSGPRKQFCSKTQRGLKWTGRTVCIAPKTCKTPGVMHGANWTLASADKRSHHGDGSFSPNTKINITCWPGFVLVGESHISCEMTGTWTPSVPACHEIQCPPLLDMEATIEHLHSDMENRTHGLGEVVHYHCDEGYKILGRYSRVCSGPSSRFPNQTWTGLDPLCTEITCPDPGNIQYGSRYLTSRHIAGNVTFRCRSGYQLHGSALRHCLPNGKWSGTLTTCDHESFYCPNPGIPIGGRMVNAVEVRFRRGERVIYDCNGDSVLVGSEERECTKSRSWTGEAPTCQGQFDFDDTVEIAERLGYNAESLAIDTHVSPVSNNSTGPSGRTIDLSYTGGMDIYFVFDASSSISSSDFQSSLELAKALVRKIGVADGPSRARYGACVYASQAQLTLLVTNLQISVAVVNAQIDEIAKYRKTHDLGTGTATVLALKMIHTDMIPLSDRPDAKKILFLFTDGKANMGGNEFEQAEILRNDYNVDIHCIAVGSEVGKTELQQIVSTPISEHLFFIADFEELNLLAQTITRQKLDFSPCGYNGGPAHVRQAVIKARIAGGESASEGQWPWQVALFCRQNIENCNQCEDKFFCGGSLIAQNWVLTASHCFRKCSWSDIRVYTGMLDKSSKSLLEFDPNLVYTLDAQVIKHEDYNDNSLDNDIALLRLSRNVTLSSRIRTLCMPQPSMTDDSLYSTNGFQASVTGWGTTQPYDIDTCDKGDGNRPTSRFLKELVIPLRTNDVCKDSFRNNNYKCSHVSSYKPRIAFCAGYSEGGLDACKGDSGGPVMRKMTFADGTTRWVQIGIVSWGEGCAVEGRYGIYTRVFTYTEWIQNHVGNAIFNVH